MDIIKLVALIVAAGMAYTHMGVLTTFAICKVDKEDESNVFGWGIVWPVTVLFIFPAVLLWRGLNYIADRPKKLPKATSTYRRPVSLADTGPK
jgi:hypothetical protein